MLPCPSLQTCAVAGSVIRNQAWSAKACRTDGDVLHPRGAGKASGGLQHPCRTLGISSSSMHRWSSLAELQFCTAHLIGCTDTKQMLEREGAEQGPCNQQSNYNRSNAYPYIGIYAHTPKQYDQHCKVGRLITLISTPSAVACPSLCPLLSFDMEPLGNLHQIKRLA